MFSAAELEAYSRRASSRETVAPTSNIDINKHRKEKEADNGQTSATKSKSSKKKKETEEKVFFWEDDEVELLLSSTLEYKTRKTLEGTDWESVKSKYQDILDIYRENESAATREGDGNHTKPPLTKEIVTTKIKALRRKYREAVDDGRRSGHGRVVAIFYEICEKIWGGSPATEKLEDGIETVDLTLASKSMDTESSPSSTSHSPPRLVETLSDDLRDGESSSTTSPSASSISDSGKQRRELLDNCLKNHRQERLKRKASADAQLLSVMQEEVQLKKKFFDEMRRVDDEHKKTVQTLTENMTKMTDALTSGFAMIQQVFSNQAAMPVMNPSRGPMATLQPTQPFSFVATNPPNSLFGDGLQQGMNTPLARATSQAMARCWSPSFAD